MWIRSVSQPTALVHRPPKLRLFLLLSRGWTEGRGLEMELDGLLERLEERANTARTIFMLLDGDADGLVEVFQVRRRAQNSVDAR